MSMQQNDKLIQQFYAAFKRGDINSVLSTLADDVDWLVPGPQEAIPFVGQRKGHEQVARAIAEFTAMQNAEQFELRRFVIQDDEVIALGHYRWQIKSTGLSYESDFAHVFTVSDGKISHFQEYLDTQAWAAAYGVAPLLSATK